MSKQKLLLGGVGCAALLAFGALFTHIVQGLSSGAAEKLNFALALLDEGRWDLAGRLARDLNEAGLIDPEHNSTWHYVQGVSKLQSVQEDLDTPKNRGVLLDAIEHLEKSEELGFPAGYQGKGQFHLGFCYFNTYRWDPTIDKLRDSAMLWPARRSDAFRMVIDAQLSKSPPDIQSARQSLAAWQAIPGMSASELARIRLTQAHIAYLENKPQECEQLLTTIDEQVPEYFEALLWRGRWRLEQARRPDVSPTAATTWPLEAEVIFRKVIVIANTPNRLRRQAAYLSAKNFRQQGRFEEALGTFSGVRQRSPRSAEAIASGIEEAEILLGLGHLDDVVATIHHILRNIESASLYNAYWLPIDELRTRLLEIGRELREQKEYERVIQIADYIALAFPLNNSVRLQAETFEQWGNDLREAPPGKTVEEKALRRELVASRFLLAGQKFEQLAGLELRSSEYPETLWHTIENFQNANNLHKANSLLADYLRFEDRTKRPRGFLALGRNHMHAGEWTQALDALERCLVEYPTNPVSYEARLLAAKAREELNDLDQAIELLQGNLGDYQLDPKSQIWQDSLFELGQTIFRRGDRLMLDLQLAEEEAQPVYAAKLEQSHLDFIEATQRLGEAVSRYPQDPRYYEARYLVAKSFRLAAEAPAQLANSSDTIVESARRQLMQQRRALLEQALTGFRTLHQTINAKQDAVSSSEQNVAITRNCYFGEADVLFDLGRWDEAIQAYRNAASRFLNQPESLEALVQMAICHRKMGREFEAKKTLGQAAQVLRRIPAEYDSHFVSFTRANRQEWDDLIGWLRKWD